MTRTAFAAVALTLVACNPVAELAPDWSSPDSYPAAGEYEPTRVDGQAPELGGTDRVFYGVVREASTGEAVAGVEVCASGAIQDCTSSDRYGFYVLTERVEVQPKPIEGGAIVLRFSQRGYYDQVSQHRAEGWISQVDGSLYAASDFDAGLQPTSDLGVVVIRTPGSTVTVVSADPGSVVSSVASGDGQVIGGTQPGEQGFSLESDGEPACHSAAGGELDEDSILWVVVESGVVTVVEADCR